MSCIQLPKKSYEKRFLEEVKRFENSETGDWGVYKCQEEPKNWTMRWKGKEWHFIKRVSEETKKPLARTTSFFQAECYLHYCRMEETKERCKGSTYTEGKKGVIVSFSYTFKDPQGGEQTLQNPNFITLHTLSEKYD